MRYSKEELFGGKKNKVQLVTRPTKSIRVGRSTQRNSKEIMLQHIVESNFDDIPQAYLYKAFLQYFIFKAGEKEVRYIRGNNLKEVAIMKSLVENFTASEIKNMIDFLWSDDNDIVKGGVRYVTIYHLSKGWINSIYQASDEWSKGTYQVKGSSKRVIKRRESKNIVEDGGVEID